MRHEPVVVATLPEMLLHPQAEIETLRAIDLEANAAAEIGSRVAQFAVSSEKDFRALDRRYGTSIYHSYVSLIT